MFPDTFTEESPHYPGEGLCASVVLGTSLFEEKTLLEFSKANRSQVCLVFFSE